MTGDHQGTPRQPSGGTPRKIQDAGTNNQKLLVAYDFEGCEVICRRMRGLSKDEGHSWTKPHTVTSTLHTQRTLGENISGSNRSFADVGRVRHDHGSGGLAFKD